MLAWAEWAGFKTLQDPQLEGMVLAARDFVLDIKVHNKPRWLSLLGTSGAGKTYLARRIFKWAKANLQPKFDETRGEICYPATWIHWPETAKDLRNQCFNALHEAAYDIVVFIDEIGSVKDSTGFISDELANFLCRRVGRWTVLTSNLHADTMGEIDSRIPSRMGRDGSVVVDVDVIDYALRGKI